jgi:hypothetical protein
MTGGTGLYPAVLRSPPGSGPARGLLRVPGRRLIHAAGPAAAWR